MKIFSIYDSVVGHYWYVVAASPQEAKRILFHYLGPEKRQKNIDKLKKICNDLQKLGIGNIELYEDYLDGIHVEGEEDITEGLVLEG